MHKTYISLLIHIGPTLAYAITVMHTHIQACTCIHERLKQNGHENDAQNIIIDPHGT